jgi:hypothetical protein
MQNELMKSPSPPEAKMSHPAVLPPWARELVTLYESGAANGFVLYGNIDDRMVLPVEEGQILGNLQDFLLRVLLPRFDVVLSYDLGNGIRIERGGEIFTQWPAYKDNPQLPKNPRPAIETLTHYFRYCANLSRLKTSNRTRVACIIKAAHLVAPALPGSLNYDLNALALLMRDWTSDTLLTDHDLATFLVTENLSDLHALLSNNALAAQIKIPLPAPDDLCRAFALLAPQYGTALGEYSHNVGAAAEQLAGATLSSVESRLKTAEHQKTPIRATDLALLKKQLVEKDCNGLIEFIESKKSLDDLYGQEKIKAWLRADIALWNQGDLGAMPMGYLLCGPVGTGKTFMVECLAGEAGVPVVKLKNFRDKWVGSTEGNLEKIFRLLHALGRCYVFIDAEEMSKSTNRGHIVWVLASSRPDLIEVDLKRPGRVDVKIPIFPTTSTREGFTLLRALCKRRGLTLEESDFAALENDIPNLLTPGAAEALAIKVYRLAQLEKLAPLEAMKRCLADYQNPVPPEVLAAQIELAIREASDLDFVPEVLRHRSTT